MLYWEVGHGYIIFVPWTGGRNDTIDLGKVMTFDADKILQIVKNGQSVYTGRWEITKNELGGV